MIGLIIGCLRDAASVAEKELADRSQIQSKTKRVILAPIFSVLLILVSNDELHMDGSNLVSYASNRENDALHAVASARRGMDRK